ncbi:uncharacterized protein METZ01_LOCUS447304, partial [marine metagenome]
MRYLVILLVVIIPVLFTSCDEALLSELDTVAAENEEQAVADSLLNARLDSLLTIILDQQDARIDSLLTIIIDQQAYIDSLNNAQHVADSLDNLTLQAYIDSLINAGNVSDSLIQVYVDSLITVQNTNNATQLALIEAQQTTLTALANSALSAGFVETQVYSESFTINNTHNIIWKDVDLSSVVGNKTSAVLIKINQQSSNGNQILL